MPCGFSLSVLLLHDSLSELSLNPQLGRQGIPQSFPNSLEGIAASDRLLKQQQRCI